MGLSEKLQHVISVDNLVGLHSFSIYFPATSQPVCAKCIRTKSVEKKNVIKSLGKLFYQKKEPV